jgi:hypothetical protein
MPGPPGWRADERIPVSPGGLGRPDAEAAEMTDEKKPADPKPVTEDKAASDHKITRRRFTKAGAIAPVVMTLGSRPVWGETCSFSGQLSGNEYSTAAPGSAGYPPSHYAVRDERTRQGTNLPDGITFQTQIVSVVTNNGAEDCYFAGLGFGSNVKFGDLLPEGVSDLSYSANAAAAVLNIVNGKYGYEMHGLMEFLCKTKNHPEAVDVLICLNNRS